MYRTLGKTGIKVPVVSMGTGNTMNPGLIKEALKNGVKLFATSQYYHNGNNEKMLGEVFKEYPRDSFMILTGATGGLEIDHVNGIFKPETDPELYLENAYGCLDRLQLDYIDFLSLGFAAKRESVFYEPILKAVQKFKADGKAKYLTIATHKLEPEAIRAAADTGVYDAIVTAYNFRKENTPEINDAIEYATGKGLGIIAMKTMAGAFWDRERKEPINTKAALKWVLQNENIHTTVPDCSTFDQLHQDIGLMANLKLSSEEEEDLKKQSPTASSGIYCQQCNQCIPQCPQNVDIPTIMRSYMYAYGHNNLPHAKHTLSNSGINAIPCKLCSECNVSCQMGFDVKTKILDIDRLRSVPEDFVRIT